MRRKRLLEAAKIAEAEARAQANAATLVQAHVRGMLARGQYSRDRELVIKLQMAARRWVLRRKWKRLETERLEKEAALEAAKIAEAEARAQANAATLVQAHVRGMLARGQYSRDRELVIKLQMAARRWVLRRKWKRLETERLEKEAALEAAKIAEAEASARNRAAVIIQSRLRGAICRARYAHDRAGILHTQFLVRAWLIRRRLRAAVDAAVTHNQRSPRPGRFSIRVVHADRLKNTQILGGWKPYVWIRCGEREVRSRAVPNASYLSSVETLQCVVDGDELKPRGGGAQVPSDVLGHGRGKGYGAARRRLRPRERARARVALVDKRGTPGAGDLTLRISFEAASRPGRRSLGGHGRIAAEPHGRLHDATREARSLEHSKRSGEGGSRTNDDGTPSRARETSSRPSEPLRAHTAETRTRRPNRNLIQSGTCRRRTRPGLRRRTFRCRERPRRNDGDDVLCFPIPNRRMTRRREAPVRFGRMNAAGEPHERRETVDTRETTRRLVTYHRYSRTIDASLYHRGDPVRPFPVPTARLRRGTVHERLLSLELADQSLGPRRSRVRGRFRPAVCRRGILGAHRRVRVRLEESGAILGQSHPAHGGHLIRPAHRPSSRAVHPRAHRRRRPTAKYLSQKSMEKRTR